MKWTLLALLFVVGCTSQEPKAQVNRTTETSANAKPSTTIPLAEALKKTAPAYVEIDPQSLFADYETNRLGWKETYYKKRFLVTLYFVVTKHNEANDNYHITAEVRKQSREVVRVKPEDRAKRMNLEILNTPRRFIRMNHYQKVDPKLNEVFKAIIEIDSEPRDGMYLDVRLIDLP